MRARLLVAMSVVGAVASGCVVNVPESPPRGVIVNSPPPEPVHEEPTPRPSPNAVWVRGYWHWTGMQYAWIPGHWEAAPPGGGVWAPPRVTSMSDGRYVYESGAWKRPPPPADRR